MDAKSHIGNKLPRPQGAGYSLLCITAACLPSAVERRKQREIDPTRFKQTRTATCRPTPLKEPAWAAQAVHPQATELKVLRRSSATVSSVARRQASRSLGKVRMQMYTVYINIVRMHTIYGDARRRLNASISASGRRAAKHGGGPCKPCPSANALLQSCAAQRAGVRGAVDDV